MNKLPHVHKLKSLFFRCCGIFVLCSLTFEGRVQAQNEQNLPPQPDDIPAQPNPWVKISGSGTKESPWTIIYRDDVDVNGAPVAPTVEIVYVIVRSYKSDFLPNVSLTHKTHCSWIRLKSKFVAGQRILLEAQGKTSHQTKFAGFKPDGSLSNVRTEDFKQFDVETRSKPDPLIGNRLEVVQQNLIQFQGNVDLSNCGTGTSVLWCLTSQLPTLEHPNWPTKRLKAIVNFNYDQVKWYLYRRLLGVDGVEIVPSEAEEKEWTIPGKEDLNSETADLRALLELEGGTWENVPSLPAFFPVYQFWSTDVLEFMDGIWNWLPTEWEIDNSLPWDGYV